jgi:hypothetical protein
VKAATVLVSSRRHPRRNLRSSRHTQKLWADTPRLHEVIASSIDPITALSVGIKVDADSRSDRILSESDHDRIGRAWGGGRAPRPWTRAVRTDG